MDETKLEVMGISILLPTSTPKHTIGAIKVGEKRGETDPSASQSTPRS